MRSAVADAPALRIRNVSKTFAGTRALKNVGFDVQPGEVHAVVGHNGSGKSTLVKILSGFYSADPDDATVVEVAGHPVKLEDRGASRDAGLRFVHQDLGLVSNLNTIENMALARGYQTGFGRKIKWQAERERTAQALRDIGLSFDISAPVMKLRASERTGIAVARALDGIQNVRALVFDEPSATLPTSEVETLFSVVRRARDLGIGVIYISHRLDEIFEIADRVTVLRDGTGVATRDIGDIDQDQLVDLMVGANQLRGIDHSELPELGEVALQVRELCGEVIEGIDFSVRGGEVLGIAGLTGSGRDELLSMLFGARDRSGTVTVNGRDVPKGSPRKAVAAGMGLVPPERIRQALFRSNDLTVNTTITSLARHLRFGRRISQKSEREETQEWVRTLGVKPAKSSAVIGLLSGGNQQKIVMARWMRMNPAVLLLDEPTQGVDVAAKSSIHELARDAAKGGAAVVVASSDEDELADVCDRVLVIRNGRIAGELTGNDITRDRIIRMHQ